MLAKQVRLKAGGRIVSLALLGGITLSTGAGAADTFASAQSSSRNARPIVARPGFCDQGSSLAPTLSPPPTGRANAVRAATVKARCARGGMALLTDAFGIPNARPANVASRSTLASARRSSTAVPKVASVVRQPAARPATYYYAPAAGPGAWTPVPGHPSYGMGDFGGDPYSGAYGTCTWWAWYRHQGEPLMQLGNAAQWAANARAHGLSVGGAPAVGATAVFQPGVEGAGGGGHAAHVEQVLGGGWFILSEMNFYWNGGGFGRVDYRYAYAGPGVSFIY